MKFNVQLLAAIKSKGWSQKEFAKLVNDHPTFISRVINGWLNLDDARMLKYARILGCKKEEIFPDA